MLHASGQIDLLLNWLTKLSPKNIENNQEIIATTTSKIIVQHQKIIQFSENIESLFTHITLFIFASNTLLICSIGFLIVMVSTTKCITQRFVLICQRFFYLSCYIYFNIFFFTDNWNSKCHRKHSEMRYVSHNNEFRGVYALLRRRIFK